MPWYSLSMDMTPSFEPAFDAAELMQRVGWDQTLLAELVDVFCEEAPRMIIDLQRCVEAGDSGGIQKCAHALKGSVMTFSAHPATDAAAALERMAHEGVLSDAETCMAVIEREVARLRSGLIRMVEQAIR